MTREQRNYQFDFLRPQHSLFQYFTKLLEQYTKVLIPQKDITKRLTSEERNKILEDVKYRSNWIKHQEIQKRKVEEEAEKERSMWNWNEILIFVKDLPGFGRFLALLGPERIWPQGMSLHRVPHSEHPLRMPAP